MSSRTRVERGGVGVRPCAVHCGMLWKRCVAWYGGVAGCAVQNLVDWNERRDRGLSLETGSIKLGLLEGAHTPPWDSVRDLRE